MKSATIRFGFGIPGFAFSFLGGRTWALKRSKVWQTVAEDGKTFWPPESSESNQTRWKSTKVQANLLKSTKIQGNASNILGNQQKLTTYMLSSTTFWAKIIIQRYLSKYH